MGTLPDGTHSSPTDNSTNTKHGVKDVVEDTLEHPTWVTSSNKTGESHSEKSKGRREKPGKVTEDNESIEVEWNVSIEEHT